MTKVTWKATLFDKAIGDIYTAKLCVDVRPDYALYHTQQAVEKMIKGAMNCNTVEFMTLNRIKEVFSVSKV